MDNVLEFRRKKPAVVAPAGQADVDATAPQAPPSSKAGWIALGVIGLGLVCYEALKASAKRPPRRYARRNPRRRRRAA